MSGAAEALEKVRMLSRPLSDRQFEHALDAVRARLEELVTAEGHDSSWNEVLSDLTATAAEAQRTHDRRPFESLVFRTYRLILFERDPDTKDIPIPASQEERDQFPEWRVA